MGKNTGVNTKKAAGMAKKAETEAKKQAEANRQREAAEAASWNQGANLRKAGRDEAANAKADEAARKRQEKAALLAEEEAAMGAGGKSKTAGGGAAAKKKSKKPKNDLAMLEDALVKSADKKVRKKKEDAAAKKREEEAQRAAKIAADKAAADKVDPLLANTQAMIGDLELDSDNNKINGVDEPMAVGREANVARMSAGMESGIDAALQGFSAGKDSSGKAPRVTFAEFKERMMPVVKQEHPGLRLSQYQERVWSLWEKSPENPRNQPQQIDEEK